MPEAMDRIHAVFISDSEHVVERFRQEYPPHLVGTSAGNLSISRIIE